MYFKTKFLPDYLQESLPMTSLPMTSLPEHLRSNMYTLSSVVRNFLVCKFSANDIQLSNTL